MALNIKQCPYCGDYFGAKLLEKHMSTCSKKNEAAAFVCPECKKSFPNEKELKKHLKVHKRKALVN